MSSIQAMAAKIHIRFGQDRLKNGYKKSPGHTGAGADRVECITLLSPWRARNDRP